MGGIPRQLELGPSVSKRRQDEVELHGSTQKYRTSSQSAVPAPVRLYQGMLKKDSQKGQQELPPMVARTLWPCSLSLCSFGLGIALPMHVCLSVILQI